MLLIREFVLKNLLFVISIVVGLLLCGIGVAQYFSSQAKSSELIFTSAEDVKKESAPKPKISVDVEGKVIKPGVYQLEEGSRLQDALIASGGLASGADREYVSKKVNLAQKILDGAKIYIPAVGEIEAAQAVLSSSDPAEILTADIAVGDQDEELINVNTASVESLDTLPKIGPVTAQKIINGRPYGSIEELVSKKVLTQKTFDGLRDMISIN
jgi:competence protein ComEA